MQDVVDCISFTLVEDQRMLTEKRKLSKAVDPGVWALPSGGVETGETQLEAVQRELSEELGVKALNSIHLLDTEYETPSATFNMHYYAIPRWEGDINMYEADSLKWSDIEELAVNPTTDKEAVRELKRYSNDLDSEYISNKTYSQLGYEKLSSMISDERTEQYLDDLTHRLEKTDTILDVACGYGRLTVPLAKQGYAIEGVDLSSKLIQRAKEYADTEGVNASFKVGNMKDLPYEADAFDKIICMWSSYNHLLGEDEQVKALDEMHRVLRPGGIGFIEMVNGDKTEIQDALDKEGIGPSQRIHPAKHQGEWMYDYIHDSRTAKERLNASSFTDYDVQHQMLGGKNRLVLSARK